MAVARTAIEVVRVTGSDGIGTEYRWKQNTWYLINDDRPYLDVLTTGHVAQAEAKKALETLDEPAPAGARWQRWNMEEQLARHRQLGEISLELKVPKGSTLQCYVVPTLLLSHDDVFAMVADIESELCVAAAWDMTSDRPDRSWSRPAPKQTAAIRDFVRQVEGELRCARAIRRDPFRELGPQSRRGLPLTENAIVSHWAMRRYGELPQRAEWLAGELEEIRLRGARHNPSGRQTRIADETKGLVALEQRLAELSGLLPHLVDGVELATAVYPDPLLQRDHRLRQLLRAFAGFSEEISPVESSRSQYPPVFLNSLWELWGAVWLAKEFRRLGFTGSCSAQGVDVVKSCSWRFKREDIVLEFDYEPSPTLVDHDALPPAHERDVAALEWAARNQEPDPKCPYFGSELHCSPDYMVRITTPNGKFLIVGDACLASPKHHGGTNKSEAKPHRVEHYRQTVGWAVDGRIVRCHPMGGFVLFPPPAAAWADFQQLPGVRDCALLCPSPRGDSETSRRLANLLMAVAPEMAQRAG